MTDEPRLFRPIDATFEQTYRQYHGHALVTFALRLTDFLSRDSDRSPTLLRTSSHNTSNADGSLARVQCRDTGEANE